MLAARRLYFSKVLAARKKILTTARARKNKHTARMLANARKDHSIPLKLLKGTYQGDFAFCGEIASATTISRSYKTILEHQQKEIN